MAGGPQKPEHGGKFFITPRRMIDSPAWRSLSNRARTALQIFQAHHDGFNNGRIGLGIKAVGTFMGNQNHGANARAIAELIEKGFLECMSDADWSQSKVREYRLTFIPCGSKSTFKSATNEYLDWRPAHGTRRKFGAAGSTTKTELSDAVTATRKKFPVAMTANGRPETGVVSRVDRVAETAAHITNQSSAQFDPKRAQVSSSGIDLSELRGWTLYVIEFLGFGGQKRLAASSKVPEPVLSKFKAGANLPSHHHINLQAACARFVRYDQWRAEISA